MDAASPLFDQSARNGSRHISAAEKINIHYFYPIQNYLTKFIPNFLPSDALGQAVAPQPLLFQTVETFLFEPLNQRFAVTRTPIQPAGFKLPYFPIKVRFLRGFIFVCPDGTIAV